MVGMRTDEVACVPCVSRMSFDRAVLGFGRGRYLRRGRLCAVARHHDVKGLRRGRGERGEGICCAREGTDSAGPAVDDLTEGNDHHDITKIMRSAAHSSIWISRRLRSDAAANGVKVVLIRAVWS